EPGETVHGDRPAVILDRAGQVHPRTRVVVGIAGRPERDEATLVEDRRAIGVQRQIDPVPIKAGLQCIIAIQATHPLSVNVKREALGRLALWTLAPLDDVLELPALLIGDREVADVDWIKRGTQHLKRDQLEAPATPV